MKALKMAAAVIVTLGTIAGGVLGANEYFCKQRTFLAFTEQYRADRLEDQYDRVIRRIWDYEDRLKENPGSRELQERLRELRFQRERIREKIEKGGN